MSRPTGLHAGVRTRGGVDIVDVSGVANPHHCDATVLRQVTRLLESGSCLFVLNLTRALVLDSALLGEVVACRERIRKRGGVTTLLLTSEQADLLMAGGLDALFEIFLDEDVALDSFAATSATAGIP